MALRHLQMDLHFGFANGAAFALWALDILRVLVDILGNTHTEVSVTRSTHIVKMLLFFVSY